MCSQCLSHTGPAPANGTHCSGSSLLLREPSEASPGLHAPPQSKPLRFGAQVALRGTDSVGTAFCAIPGPSSSGVWRARSLRLVAFSASAAQFSGWTAGAPCEADGDCPEPPEVLVSKEACLHFGRQCLSWTAIAPFQPLWLWLPVTGGGWSTARYFCSILCSVRGPGGVFCSSFMRGSYPTVWFASPS